MEVIDKLVAIAEDAVKVALSDTSKNPAILDFREFDYSGTKNSLMLVGYVSHEIEDGSCAAVLNPDLELRESLKPNVGYSSQILKKMAAQKCDALVQVWVDAYKPAGKQLSILGKYKSKNLIKE